MPFQELPNVGDLIQIWNETGTYRLLITHIKSDELGRRAKGRRWNEKRGVFTKASNFCVWERRNEYRLIKTGINVKGVK